MKNITYKFSIICAVLMFFSCKKALDVRPVSNITNASFWKTEDDVKGGINGMYVKLRADANDNMFVWGEARSGDMTSALAGTLGYDRYYNNFMDVANPGPNWSGAYTTINAANLLIKYVPGIKFTSEDNQNNALAQAYTMRAYEYFVLARTFGGVPLRTVPMETYDPATIQLPRTPVADIFKFIKSDVNKAIALFKDNTFTARDKWSRPSASALKAEVYLWTAKMLAGGQKDLDTALAAINIAQGSDVQLLSNYKDVFDYTNKGNKEILMAVHYQVLESSNTYYQNMYLHSSNITPNTAPADRAFIGPVGTASVNTMQVAPFVRDQFSIDDQRRAGTFYEVHSTDGTVYTTIVTKGMGTVQNGVRYFMDDIILYRYADVLLMKAEIKNALGQDPSDEINQVRKRAYGANYASHVFVSGSMAQNDDSILKERLLELATEGKYWWDVVRFGKAFTLVPSLQGKAGNDYLLLFPIGLDVISREPLVTENPGWK